ncbi:MAG: hypothetical protein IPL21_07755 [Saprospirales bacterium]|nr:hypothetical protein [Saprospirales bacterium]
MRNKIILLLAVAILMTSCHSTKIHKTEYSAISDNFKSFENTETSQIVNTNSNNTTENNQDQKTKKKPNVIIVMSDDLDAIYTPQYFPKFYP